MNEDYELAQLVLSGLISVSTSDESGCTNKDYMIFRKRFMQNVATKRLLPECVKKNRDFKQFWPFIQRKFPTYAERRNYLYSEFTDLLDYLEGPQQMPADNHISSDLKNFSEEEIHCIWEKALERRTRDSEGAITIAKTLLEATCKHILDELSIEYESDKIELHELYKITAKELSLSPSQHDEDIFKQILGGCSGVVSGLGRLRNKFSDAHGSGKMKIKPAARHAELAVNLSGSVAMFLIKTLHSKKRTDASFYGPPPPIRLHRRLIFHETSHAPLLIGDLLRACIPASLINLYVPATPE